MPPATHLTTPRPWSPLSDAEWTCLEPYLTRAASRPGPRIADLRARMDAIFRIAATNDPWRLLPAEYGRPDTISRFFRRLTHEGLWQRLLAALAERSIPDHLRALEHWICRACRRATRILGLRFIVLIRRLGFLSALKGPPHMVPNPDLSETIRRFPLELAFRPDMQKRGRNLAIRALMALHRMCGGVKRIPRRLAPP
ncbi:transposase [Roseomonas sp. HJA6]|uniref:Transposase n=1 Tax=Roseomonas alba TaxID=2846776 RepID=A0ABS7A577_9PROT|nr:transposase [Neoroseomonas alba]MBW6397456.1 transposase [Neoroseomonas alba]